MNKQTQNRDHKNENQASGINDFILKFKNLTKTYGDSEQKDDVHFKNTYNDDGCDFGIKCIPEQQMTSFNGKNPQLKGNLYSTTTSKINHPSSLLHKSISSLEKDLNKQDVNNEHNLNEVDDTASDNHPTQKNLHENEYIKESDQFIQKSSPLRFT
mmetsp:Transcript_20211/g.28425  ORF Transcript_20211/g.28425 Transcript_20211/m.28425 type:complete len:156 (+) Transcript_20211:250-717(+)